MSAAVTSEASAFRYSIGLLCLLAGIGGFAGLYFIEVPPQNRDAMMFALGNIFGWGALVVTSEYGASTTGRRVAEQAIRQMETSPTGTPTDPVSVTEEGRRDG